jgi:hypothetical protein
MDDKPEEVYHFMSQHRRNDNQPLAARRRAERKVNESDVYDGREAIDVAVLR